MEEEKKKKVRKHGEEKKKMTCFAFHFFLPYFIQRQC